MFNKRLYLLFHLSDFTGLNDVSSDAGVFCCCYGDTLPSVCRQMKKHNLATFENAFLMRYADELKLI